jgi:hypothetical protein
MDIEIPDNEDAACVLDLLCSTLAGRGQYTAAEDCIGAARRLRADAEEIARLEAELAELRADLEWAATYAARWMVGRDADHALEWDDLSVLRESTFDGTPDDLRRVIRKARQAEAKGDE